MVHHGVPYGIPYGMTRVDLIEVGCVKRFRRVERWMALGVERLRVLRD